MHNNHFEVIIIGGSYAGLSAAMALGRSLRKVLVLDNHTPCNAQTPHSHNFLTQDGQTPAQIATIARQQVQEYPTVTLKSGLAIKGNKTTEGFQIIAQSGDVFTGKKIVFATGILDQLPSIPGFTDCWGISAVHCPYCHGYEYRNQKTGILANGDEAIHYAQLVSNLTKHLTIFTQGPATFSTDQIEKLKLHQIEIVETEIANINHEKGYMSSLTLKDAISLDINALYFRPPFSQQSDIPLSLGCEFTEQGHIKTDGFCKTSVPDVFACGDNSSMMRSVANAVATGNMTGAMVNRELTDSRF